ncbi:MAG: CvpA family protein [Candidatus Uhrbacteria bacterium]|nr:CvpA family protein [Candidatus Uhrbacteria bacterium]
MNYADIALIIIVGSFVAGGVWYGLFRSLGSLVGTIVAAIFTGSVIDFMTHKFGFLFGGGEIARVVIYLIVFMIISRLVGLVFWIISKLLGIVLWMPFLKTIDHLLGGLFGFIEGIIVVGFVLLYASHIFSPELMHKLLIDHSAFAKYVLQTVTTLELFLPDIIRNFIFKYANVTTDTISKGIPKMP